jgi:hypothetical protein
MKFMKPLLIVALGLVGAGQAMAAVPPEEAAKLGNELTPFGAEKAGNADGTIPAWTGGLTTPPATYEMGSGLRPDPWADEEPYLVITKDNMAQYADQLTEGSKALLERLGDDGFQIKVWPSHRSFAGPDWYYENTVYNATHTQAVEDSLRLEDVESGTPFPIPKNGNEVYWNHLLRWEGTHIEAQYKAIYVDKNGDAVLATTATVTQEWPHYNRDKDYGTGFEDYYMIRVDYTGPARRAGEKVLIIDPMDFTGGAGRRAWQYLKGQRRVRRAPSVAFDTPNSGVAGVASYDDAFMINGSPERFDYKLVGKKEMYVPYNGYDIVYMTPSSEALGAEFINPDRNRWEKHRVWVIEGTLKEGSRHIYHRRVFYVDEDSWAMLSSDQYDGKGDLWRIGFSYQAPSYEIPAGLSILHGHYDLQAGIYYVNGFMGDNDGVFTDRAQKPTSFWTPQGLAAGGVR